MLLYYYYYYNYSWPEPLGSEPGCAPGAGANADADDGINAALLVLYKTSHGIGRFFQWGGQGLRGFGGGICPTPPIGVTPGFQTLGKGGLENEFGNLKIEFEIGGLNLEHSGLNLKLEGENWGLKFEGEG